MRVIYKVLFIFTINSYFCFSQSPISFLQEHQKLNWESAKQFCNQLNINSEKWRLPTYYEALVLIHDDEIKHNAIWTQSNYALMHSNKTQHENVWVVNKNGETLYKNKQQKLHFICIEDKKHLDNKKCYRHQTYFLNFKVKEKVHCNE